MILTVTLNPCLHRVVSFHGDPSRQIIRPVEGVFMVGGKGVNVARVAMRMGAPVTALITAGGAVGRLMCDTLVAEGLGFEAIAVANETRMSTIVLSGDDRGFREYLEPGREVSSAEVEELRARYLSRLDGASLVTLNGSVPDPRLDDFHAFAVREARRRDVPVIVDTYGAPLPLAAEEGPNLLKANLDELRSSFGMDLRRLEDATAFARAQLGRGSDAVLITDGAAGAGLWLQDQELRVVSPEVMEIHPVGCGDAMLGAMAAHLEETGYATGHLVEAIKNGAAAGAANAATDAVGDVDPAAVQALRAGVSVRSLVGG